MAAFSQQSTVDWNCQATTTTATTTTTSKMRSGQVGALVVYINGQPFIEIMTPTRSVDTAATTTMQCSTNGSSVAAVRESQLSAADGDHQRASLLYGSGANFLISFLVDARGGVMENSRLKGLRLILPPQAVAAPTRITCKVVRREARCNPPALQFSEGLATRIVQFGPVGMKLAHPVCIEVPLCAATSDNQREFVVQRSENGEAWNEHAFEVTEAKQNELFAALKQSVTEGGSNSADDVIYESEKQLRDRAVCRIFTNDFPAYFAIVSRVRLDATQLDSEGGVLLSRTVSAAQAVFPDGALQKRIRIALQTHVISRDWLTLLSLDERINDVSPVLTVEPRRRKFHKPILLAIPVQRTYQPNEIDGSRAEQQSLRLLCSIATETNGQAPSWEDITGSTQLKTVKNCVTFSTTVSAKYWLIDTMNPASAVAEANRLYQAAASVPYTARCYVFVRPYSNPADEVIFNSDENSTAQKRDYDFRVFVACEDVFSKSLETQEGFVELARSEPFEVRHGAEYLIELSGNLVVVRAGGDEQVPFRFTALADNANRLAFVVRTRDMNLRRAGTFSITRSPKPTLVQQSKRPDLFRPAVTLSLDLTAASGLQEQPQAPEGHEENGCTDAEVFEQVDALKSDRHNVAHQSVRKQQIANDEDRHGALSDLANALSNAFASHETELAASHDHKHGDGDDCHSVHEEAIEASQKTKN